MWITLLASNQRATPAGYPHPASSFKGRAIYNERVTSSNLVSRSKLAITISGIALLSAGVVWFTSTRAASDPTGLADTTPQGPGLERYVDSGGGSLFDYPVGLKITVTDDSDDHVIFGDTPSGETRLMIVAYPYVLDEPFTEKSIRAQPFADDIISPIESSALPDGTTAFLFRRADTPLGPTHDALFVHNGAIYQVSAGADFEALFAAILTTWHFVSTTTQ
jgi:hypothetical protein